MLNISQKNRTQINNKGRNEEGGAVKTRNSFRHTKHLLTSSGEIVEEILHCVEADLSRAILCGHRCSGLA